MTDLESPRKNNDCYFYYYSTCTKGDNCTFRHEPSALGCETTCSFWKEGKCINVRCNFRHMELRKNRKTIPCYWESQPSGCKKQHCPFMHVNKKDGDENDNLSVDHDDICNIKSKKDDFAAPVVDPIVVNFEEESDNESSTPTQSSHHKSTNQSRDHLLQTHRDRADHQPHAQNARAVRGSAKIVEVKTLEEIKLDRIQAESAAYYSYSDELTPKVEEIDSLNGRRGVFKRLQPLGSLQNPDKTKEVNIKDVQVLTLEEIRRRKRKNQLSDETLPSENKDDIINKKQKVINEQPENIEERPIKKINKKTKVVTEIKIKTLAEIKAEKQLKLKRKLEDEDEDGDNSPKDLNQNNDQSEIEPETKQLPSKRVKITLSKEPDEQEVSSTSKTDENQLSIAQDSSPEATIKVQCVVAPVKRHIEVDLSESEAKPDLPQYTPETNVEQTLTTKSSELSIDTEVSEEKIEQKQDVSTNDEVVCDDSKLDDLLLDDDDEDAEGGSLTLKAEDDILNDIDDLLNE